MTSVLCVCGAMQLKVVLQFCREETIVVTLLLGTQAISEAAFSNGIPLGVVPLFFT